MRGTDIRGEPLVILFSATSALSDSQGLTDRMSSDIIVMSPHSTLSSQQDTISYDITMVMVFHGGHSDLSNSDKCQRPNDDPTKANNAWRPCMHSDRQSEPYSANSADF